jgi:hypothetical protein
MSTARFHQSLCLLFAALFLTGSSSQAQPTISIMIDPPEATVHIGETQSFMAVVNGAVNAGIQWVVQETDGGSITEEGIYTAPKNIGVYHVIAMATIDGATLTQAVAKVTVVMQYDTRPN